MLANHVSYNRVVQQMMTKSVLRYVAAAALVFAIVYTYHTLIRVNPTIVALTFLLAVLVVSARWGLRHAVFMAVVATLAFNYFFLPPVGTFTIADPQNWAALFAFLVTAVIASQLSERARREARNANERRRDVERLYDFSQQLLSSDHVAELLNAIPRYVVESFGVKAAAISLPGRARRGQHGRFRCAPLPSDAGSNGQPYRDSYRKGRHDREARTR